MKIKIKPDIAISETGLIFNPRTGESFTINPVGMDLIKLIRQGRSPEEIKKIMLDDYDTDAENFDKDYSEFLLLLRGYNLLEE